MTTEEFGRLLKSGLVGKDLSSRFSTRRQSSAANLMEALMQRWLSSTSGDIRALVRTRSRTNPLPDLEPERFGRLAAKVFKTATALDKLEAIYCVQRHFHEMRSPPVVMELVLFSLLQHGVVDSGDIEAWVADPAHGDLPGKAEALKDVAALISWLRFSPST